MRLTGLVPLGRRAIWVIAEAKNTFPERIRRQPKNVGMRGSAALEPIDLGRAARLLARYLGPQ